MKRIVVSVGLAAAGAAGLPSALAQSLAPGPSPKIWNVAANLRGFYDDNYAVAHNKQGSFGFELSPSVSVNESYQQTDIGLRYTFGMYYYIQRATSGINPLDYTHQADLWLDHAFNERFKLNVTDSLVIAQDPALVQGGSTVRVNGNNLNNHAAVTLSAEWTRQFSTATHYGINYIDYSNSGATNNPNGTNPSNAELLNRIEQNVGNDFQWHFQPETMGFIGYNFSWVRYTGNGLISPSYSAAPSTFYQYPSGARNSRTHYGYVGLSEQFSPNLSGEARVGASYTEVYNDPVSPYTSVAPYADINVTYTYIPGSYVQAGFTQDQNSTDISTPNTQSQRLTEYQQSSVFYMNVNHQFTPKLNGSVIGQYQYSKYVEGAYNGTGDNSIHTGINFNYWINQHFSANAGYTFDELFSSISGRGNSRNVVYLGLGANY
jgi:hypothetical protein